MLNKNSIAKLEYDDEPQAAQPLDQHNLLETGIDDAYITDDRSGDEVTDSEKEFEEIVGLDNIIKSIVESTLEVNELHSKISELFAKMSTLKDLIDFDAIDIKDIIEGMVAKEILYFTNFTSIVKIVEHAYKI